MREKKINGEMNAACSERIRDVKQSQYKEKDGDVKRRVTADKRNMNNEAEHAVNSNNMCTLYRMTKELCNKKRQSTTGVRDKEGKLIIEEDKLLQRWQEYLTNCTILRKKLKETT
jgi:membrane-associated HD superfamily phosphohydrolase